MLLNVSLKTALPKVKLNSAKWVVTCFLITSVLRVSKNKWNDDWITEAIQEPLMGCDINFYAIFKWIKKIYETEFSLIP